MAIRRRKFSSRSISNTWYKFEDSKGVFFTPYRKKEYSYYPVPENKKQACEWLSRNQRLELHESGSFAHEYNYPKNTSESVTLPSGNYFYENNHYEDECLRRLDLRNDKFIRIGGVREQVLTEIKCFLQNKRKYHSLGIPFRIGFLLYGKPGNGKTLLIRDIIQNELPNNAISFYCHDLPKTSFLQAINRTLKGRIKVFVFEELLAVINRSRIERILDFLDGETSSEGALIFATTNYPEHLPGNIVERPSRFDKVYEITEPNKESRKLMLEFFFKRAVTKEEVALAEGLSSADLKELVLLNKIYEIPFDMAVARLKAHHKLAKKQFAKKVEIGIHSHEPDWSKFD